VNLHPRHVPVEHARRDLGLWLVDWQARHDLTDAECLLLVGEALTDRLRAGVRAERDGGDQ
jgi:hypothetical protein